jgi:RimJ/RimL family protein N-acetyltransferase
MRHTVRAQRSALQAGRSQVAAHPTGSLKSMPRLEDSIETQRLILRKPRIGDAAPIFAGWTQDAEVTRYLTWRPHAALSHTEHFLALSIDAWNDDERTVYVITTRETDVPIGLIEARFESTFAASVGYVLRRSEWNRGYMTEACRAVVDRLVALPEIWRVWAYCDIENAASARVLERSGMQHEGVSRRAILHPNRSETPRDVHLYARVR